MLRSPTGMTSVGGWQTIFGQAVRSRRLDLELTLEEASAATGVSRSHLNLIELGKATGISRDCAARIDAGLGSEGALLAILPMSAAEKNPAQVATRGEEMRRLEFNKAVLALAATLLLDPERLLDAEAVDAALLDDHEALTADFAHRQHHARPQVILGPIREHLKNLLDLAGASAPPSLRPRLARVTAETAAIAGWVAFRGNGDLVTAHGQLAFGRERAREAGDNVLMAQLLAASSSLYSPLDIPQMHKSRGSTLALSLLHAAERRAGSSSPQLQGWLAARVAVEQAVLGEGRRARAALTRAEATLSSSQHGDRAGLFVIWDDTRLPGYAGKTLLLLGDPAATRVLEQALAMTSAPHPRLGLLIDLSMAQVRDGDADYAVTLLVEATQLALARGIDRFARWRLQEGRSALPTTHQHVFDSQLSMLA
jgi:hypothetical protein